MNSATYNALVDAAAGTQPLNEPISPLGGSAPDHHWRVEVERDTASSRWRVHVGAGTVNDRVASIGYLRNDDPRGWVMPLDHPSIPLMRQIYGDGFRFVDRELIEQVDPPYLLLTVPSPGGSSDLGDFREIPDDHRLPVPQFFRTAEMWHRRLYAASVFLTATPKFFSRAEDLYHFPVPTRLSRFRVAIAPTLPPPRFGTVAGADHELARLYLTRSGNDSETDELYVEQRCFWSLWTASYSPTLFQSQIDPSVLFTGNPLIDVVTDTVLAAVAVLFEGSSSSQFWSAA